MKMVFKYLEKYYGRMTLGLSIKVAGTLVELLLPYILSHILADVIGKEMSDIVFWGVLMIVCSATACLCNIIANRMAARVSRNFAETLRRDLFRKTLRLSAAQTDKFTIPSLESRITTDTYNVHHFVNMMQRMGVRAPILLMGGIAITLFMDASLSLVMIAILPLIFITVYLISRNGVPLYTKVQRSVDGMIRVVREDAQGIRVIKALSKTDYEHKRYDEVNRKLVKDEVRAGVIMGTVNPVMTMFMNVGSVAVIALGAFRVSKGLSNPETIIAFMQYFTQISMAMMTVTRMFVMYTKSAASAKRIAEVLGTQEDITVKEKSEYRNKDTKAHICFDHVSFSYKGKRNNLEDIHFELQKGGRLGIIGATGSGKSTLIKLLMRFYDVGQGGIYINGEDIRTIEKERLYAMFGSAQQYDFLYSESIEENIRFGREISHEAVEEAARIAQAHEFITAFAEGYEHKLTPHGTNISGGQKQRILISRALAGKPEILILDDSSSALDYKTDAALRKALGEHLKDTTVITVAQRVSSVKDCDFILVLEEGRIIGMGTHEELLDACVEYREISESQMGGAFVE
ncbi:MAG: ABC transporter ATP-binding protein [Lachnospiraceae bacterium]|nr:ABC transporter ATP-binding protein [Lachnospiraceae bacterium]